MIPERQKLVVVAQIDPPRLARIAELYRSCLSVPSYQQRAYPSVPSGDLADARIVVPFGVGLEQQGPIGPQQGVVEQPLAVERAVPVVLVERYDEQGPVRLLGMQRPVDRLQHPWRISH